MIKKHHIISAIENADNGADPYHQLVNLLFDSLSKRERMVYDFVKSNPSLTAGDIAAQIGMSVNNAHMLLGMLRRMGLIKRQPAYNKVGKYYEWEIKCNLL